MKPWIKALGFGLAVGLSGCAGLPEKTLEPKSEAAQHLYELPAWKLEGRIAAKMGQEGWSANLFWEHEGGQERLRISGPFNQGVVSVIVQKDLVYINEGNGVTRFSRDPDAYLRERLGFSVPLQSLRYWLLGLPAPGLDYQADEGGVMKGFKQQGWALAYGRFDQVGVYVLPKKMSIQGHGAALKLIADEWTIRE